MTLPNTQWLKQNKVCPLILNGEDVHIVAVTDACDELLLEKVRRELSDTHFCADPPNRVEVQEFTSKEIRHLILKSPSCESESISKELTEESLQGSINSWEAEPIINLVDSLIEQATEQSATDIHLEPNEKQLRIRFRIDGLLMERKELPLWVADPVLVRLKILSEIDITDKRIPHDGSFMFCGAKQNLNIRVSTIPIQGGEKCVLRLLPQDSFSEDSLKGLSHLNLSIKTTEYLRTIFKSPQGLFLVTGPTGSGKTTTLHCGLQEIIQNQINVVTIEDPVEYLLPGANQVQINEKCGFTFAMALRSVLRQDPDVIFVGEIRDEETAQIAIRASQTGHLVVSTLHTNNAKAAFNRLSDLGISKALMEESILGVLAQRLVRKKGGGRLAITELLTPKGTFIDGSLWDSARKLMEQELITEAEAHRVLGNLCYIAHHENF